MSSDTTSAVTDRGQQTLQDAAKAQLIYRPIRGIGLRVELPNEACEEFLDGFRGTRYIVINLNDARKVIDRDGDLNSVLDPYHIPVLTATEDDSITQNRSMDEVLRVYEAAQPAICVPDQSYAYQSDNGLSRQEENARLQGIAQAYVEYVKDLYEVVQAREYTIRLIPTQKGWRMFHFEPYHELREDYGITDYAFYCKQYIGGEAGNSLMLNVRHAKNFIGEVNPHNIMLIARLSPNELPKFPPRVTSACGFNQWRETSNTGNGYSQADCNRFITKAEPTVLNNTDVIQQSLAQS